jgi:pimeloyl-ACP methyl ester carboxylesterase
MPGYNTCLPFKDMICMKKSIMLLIAVLSCISLYGEEIVKIRLSDGESITGRLKLPSVNERVPLIIVFVHGTGPNTYLNKRKIGNVEFNYFDLFADEFNKRGIGFFSYNRRGVEIGDTPPYYDKIDSAKYSKYLPLTEAEDIEAIISQLKRDNRFSNSKIALLGCSEGTIIASMVADRKVVKIDGLLLFGYANDNLFDIIKWQYSGKASMINLQKFFDVNKDNLISRSEYESTDSIAVLGRTRVLQNASFDLLDIVKDSVVDFHDFAARNTQYFEYLVKMVDSGNDSWIWQNYFRVTSRWLKEHFRLEANKTRLLRIDIPVYIFNGTADGNVPIEGIYDIQSRFTQAKKTNLKCFIFEGHNHDLNYLDWPFKHEISEGLNSIFNTSELLLK